jgi:DNA-binding FadR family transcriptional regulator
MLARNIEHASTQHQAIAQAILAGDAAAARQATAEHVDATAALIRGFLG